LTGISPFELFDQGEHEWCWRDYLVNNYVSNGLGTVLEKMVILGIKKRYQGARDVLTDLGLENLVVSSQPKVAVPAIPKTQIQSAKPQTLIEILPGGIKLEMVKIPSGSFLMGSNEDDSEKPIHQVTLQSFYIGKYPVTQGQWQAVMGNNPSHFNKNSKNPVEQISWNNCQEFCQKLSSLTRKKYRLPSEAEWEYACRAGTQTRYSFGNDNLKLENFAWYDKNSVWKTHPVGKKKPNPWEIYDTHGSVWEWCEDSWHRNYQGAPTDGSAWIDSNSQSFMRMLRGGSWYNHPLLCSSTARSSNDRDSRINRYGFRLALG
jgi:formylglycine-generating enzyme required for sulfatase activity